VTRLPSLAPGGCTCRDRESDVDQEPPDTAAAPVTREQMCGDCAFQPRQPRTDLSVRGGAYGWDDLDRIVYGCDEFWCYQGMRLVVGQGTRLVC
jgi:hypothetical protein